MNTKKEISKVKNEANVRLVKKIKFSTSFIFVIAICIIGYISSMKTIEAKEIAEKKNEFDKEKIISAIESVNGIVRKSKNDEYSIYEYENTNIKVYYNYYCITEIKISYDVKDINKSDNLEERTFFEKYFITEFPQTKYSDFNIYYINDVFNKIAQIVGIRENHISDFKYFINGCFNDGIRKEKKYGSTNLIVYSEDKENAKSINILITLYDNKTKG